MLIQRQLRLAEMVATMCIRLERLRAFSGPLHRPTADALRCPKARDLFGIDEDLRAEPAADVWRNHPELVFRGNADKSRDHEPRHVRILTCRVKREVFITRLERADRGARLYGVRHQPIVDEVHPRHVLGALECLVGRRLFAE